MVVTVPQMAHRVVAQGELTEAAQAETVAVGHEINA